MDKIKEFEKAAIEAVSALRNELGAKRLVLTVMIDDYEKSCKTDASFFKSIQADASCVPRPELGGACKGD